LLVDKVARNDFDAYCGEAEDLLFATLKVFVSFSTHNIPRGSYKHSTFFTPAFLFIVLGTGISNSSGALRVLGVRRKMIESIKLVTQGATLERELSN